MYQHPHVACTHGWYAAGRKISDRSGGRCAAGVSLRRGCGRYRRTRFGAGRVRYIDIGNISGLPLDQSALTLASAPILRGAIKAATRRSLVSVEYVTRAILVLRGRRVLLDNALAAIYGVTTARLNQQVRRNRARFPGDFLFELTAGEFANLKLHFATSSWGGQRKRPHAFTEHGAIMVATVLNSPRAVAMSVYVVRAFVQLRELLASNKDLARHLDQLEARIERKLVTHEEAIAAMLSAIRELMAVPSAKRRGIGFTADLSDKT